FFFFFFSSRRRHTRFSRDWSSDVCSSDLGINFVHPTKFIGKHSFHLFVVQGADECNSPIAEVQKHLLCVFNLTIRPCISQTGIEIGKRRVGKERRSQWSAYS